MISRKAANIIAYTAGEQPQDKKYIKLNTNENPYPPSDKVISALKGADFSRLRLYPDPESTVLRTAAAKEFNLKPENVFCGNGSDEILGLAFRAFFNSKSGQGDVVTNQTSCHGDTVPDPLGHKTCPHDPPITQSVHFPDIT